MPCVAPDLPSRHLHVHLLVLLDGVPVPVPEGIGVGRPWTVEGDGFVSAGSCFAWIHTHDRTGVVHMASPESRPFTLGQVFEVWGHPLGPDGALGYRGAVTVSVDGVRVPGDPGGIELHSFDRIVLALGRPPARPPGRFDFERVRS